jgi:hypothetical protein
MKQVRRGLTLSALDVFIHHYFSLSWLREYIIDKKVYRFVHPDEEISYSLDENPIDRTQMYFDLMFLVRIGHEKYPTAVLLGEIMKLLDAIEGNYTRLKGKQPFSTPLNSIYFSIAISHKLSALQGDLATYWKQVANVPLHRQLEHNYYLEAKSAESKTLGYFVEGEFTKLLFRDELQGEMTETWLKMDIKLRSTLEKCMSRKDLIKYYRSLASEAKDEENLTLAEIWEDIAFKEEISLKDSSDYLMLAAWCHRRVSSKKRDVLLSPVIILWERVVSLLDMGFSSDFNHLRSCKREAQLGYEFEKTLIEIQQVEKQLTIRSSIDNNSNPFVNNLCELVSDIPKYFRANLRELLLTLSPIIDSDYNPEELRQLHKTFLGTQKSWKEFQLDWKTMIRSLIKALQIKDNLLVYYKDCPDLIAVIENRFVCYYESITNQFTKRKDSIQHCSEYLRIQFDKCESFRCWELFQSELLYHSIGSREKSSSSSASVHLEAIVVILQMQEFIAGCQQDYESKNTKYLSFSDKKEDQRRHLRDLEADFLKKINFLLEQLQNADISLLKRELTLEYLKALFEVYKVEMNYRRMADIYFRKSRFVKLNSTFLKVHEWLISNPMEDGANQPLEIKNWRKILELLRKLPHEDRKYFQDLMIWIINGLLAEKELDPLLLGSFQEQGYHRTDLFFSYFNLLKYYLPEKYFPQIDTAMETAKTMEIEQINLNHCTDLESRTITEINSLLKVEMQDLFEFTFNRCVFIPEKEKVPPPELFLRFLYLLPVLIAFQKKRVGLLREWGSWIRQRNDKRESQNLKLQEAFQCDNDILSSSIHNDEYYAQLNLWMICENFLEGDNSCPEFDESELISITRRFLTQSLDSIVDGNSKEKEIANCLGVVSLYLEYLEIELTNPENKVAEIEELGNKMTNLIFY